MAGGFDRQTFIDLAAMIATGPAMKEQQNNTIQTAQLAEAAYDIAEALWEERERRGKAQEQQSSEPQPSTRPGPEL